MDDNIRIKWFEDTGFTAIDDDGNKLSNYSCLDSSEPLRDKNKIYVGKVCKVNDHISHVIKYPEPSFVSTIIAKVRKKFWIF